jgi:hypothetical protein
LPKRQFVWVDAEGKGEEGGDGYDHHDGEEVERAGRPPPPGMACMSLS